MEKKRSVGVTIFSWLGIVFGLANITFFVNRIVTIFCHKIRYYEASVSETAAYMTVTDSPLIIFSILYIIAGTGMLYLKSWARKMALILLWTTFIISIFIFIRIAEGDKTFVLIFNIAKCIIPIINMFCIYYLTRPKVKAQFGK